MGQETAVQADLLHGKADFLILVTSYGQMGPAACQDRSGSPRVKQREARVPTSRSPLWLPLQPIHTVARKMGPLTEEEARAELSALKNKETNKQTRKWP